MSIAPATMSGGRPNWGANSIPAPSGRTWSSTESSCRDVFFGDRFAVGEVLLEVTAPRIPCATLAERMGDPAFPRRFQKAALPGFYCRVVDEGNVRAGDRIERERYRGVERRVSEMGSWPRREDLDPVQIQELLSIPLHWKIKDYLVGRRATP